MIEVVTRERSPEMAQRYQGTYGFLKTDSGKKLLVDIINVGARSIEVVDTKQNGYVLAYDKGIELEFTQVPSQWFQPDPDHIAFVSRRPERQYRRGICSGNTSILVPYPSGTMLQSIDVTAHRIEALFGMGSEIQAFETRAKIKCGLWSKFFAWAVDSVYVKDLLIGTVDHEIKTIKLKDATFLQEMRDALVRSNSDYTVKVND